MATIAASREREHELLAMCDDSPPLEPGLWFSKLWDSLNASRGYGWDANPWVWVLTFKRVEG